MREAKTMTINFKYIGLLLLALQLCYSKSYTLPNEMVFAGHNVPLDKFDVRERLTKSFNILVNDRRGFIQNLLEKQNDFLPYAKNILSQYGVNEDFAYIIPVESEFDPRAFSQSQASGLWQLMPATGKMYGLRVDNFVDERNHPGKSTQAAAEHLSMLSRIFNNDPFLMIAAYNNGDSNVRSMIESQNSDDFWESRSNSETEFYVEKVIVYKIILNDPEKFGFSKINGNRDNRYETCTLSLGSENLDFSEICNILDISYRELYKLNPHIKFGSYKNSGYISKYTSQDIIVPQNSSDRLISELKRRNYLSVSDKDTSGNIQNKHDLLEDTYEIRYNDNIESIAFKYGIDWRVIAEKNNLKIITLPSGLETAEIVKGQTIRITK